MIERNTLVIIFDASEQCNDLCRYHIFTYTIMEEIKL